MEEIRVSDTAVPGYAETLAAKAKAPVVDMAAFPCTLGELRHWVLWKYEVNPDLNTKPKKVPYSVQGGRAKANDPETWATLSEVRTQYAQTRRNFDGVGFMFVQGGGIIGIDLDNSCVDGKATDFAQRVVELINSYTEISPSGTGLHIIVRAQWPLTAGKRKDCIEVYPHGRYFTMTGHVYEGRNQLNENQSGVEALIRHFGWNVQPKPAQHCQGRFRYISDDGIIDKAMHAANGAKFQALFAGDTSGYKSASEADMALLSMIAFWTRGDADQTIRVFKQSGLYRDKTDRPDYLRRTLQALHEQGAIR